MSESKNEVISFTGKSIFNMFHIPNTLMFNNASYFSSLKLTEFTIDKSIRTRYASSCYPQGNRVAESSNKNIIHVICAYITDDQGNWHNALINSPWSDSVTPKGRHTKFQHLWLGPLQVKEKIGQGTYRLKILQGDTKKLPVNGHHLKRYFQ